LWTPSLKMCLYNISLYFQIAILLWVTIMIDAVIVAICLLGELKHHAFPPKLSEIEQRPWFAKWSELRSFIAMTFPSLLVVSCCHLSWGSHLKAGSTSCIFMSLRPVRSTMRRSIALAA
jgi:hypothetical protein